MFTDLNLYIYNQFLKNYFIKASACNGNLASFCQNGGICQNDLSIGFRCNCSAGFYGSQCQFGKKT